MKRVDAKKMLDFAIKTSTEKQLHMCVAIYDAHAHLLAFERMDNAMLGSIDLALAKAKTACLFKIETQELGKVSQPNMPAWSIELSNTHLCTIAGGIPVFKAGELIGSIGVSGGTADEDYQVANQCLSFFFKK